MQSSGLVGLNPGFVAEFLTATHSGGTYLWALTMVGSGLVQDVIVNATYFPI